MMWRLDYDIESTTWTEIPKH